MGRLSGKPWRARRLHVNFGVVQCEHMDDREFGMAESATMTVTIPSEVNEKLDALARDTNRTKDYLAGEAIADFVERNAWQVAHIKEALEEAKSGSPGIPHEDIERWMDSWGSADELPPPEPRA
jgi:RHH-type transcriptional regulator, rel operon repressor / antitoxin RelB